MESFALSKQWKNILDIFHRSVDTAIWKHVSGATPLEHVVTGGFFVILFMLNSRMKSPLWQKVLIGAFIIYGDRLVVGCIVNLG
jgi:hypothetical protein